MAESTLALTFDDLGKSVAHYLLGKRLATVAAGLTTSQAADVDAAVQSGYRRFLGDFEWSFLYPTGSSVLFGRTTGTAAGGLTTTFTATTSVFKPTMIGHSIVCTAGSTYTITAYTSGTAVTVSSTAAADSGKAFTITPTGAYRLPDDFGGFYGDKIRFQNNEGGYQALTITAEGAIGKMLQTTTDTGRPHDCAVQPVTTDGTTGQRFNLLVYPIPDANYTMYYRYLVLPDALVTTKYPYGGAGHAETLRKACIAAADEMFMEGSGGKENEYLRALEASKRRDRRNIRAASLGVAGDADPCYQGDDPDYYVRTVTVNGVYYP